MSRCRSGPLDPRLPRLYSPRINWLWLWHHPSAIQPSGPSTIAGLAGFPTGRPSPAAGSSGVPPGIHSLATGSTDPMVNGNEAASAQPGSAEGKAFVPWLCEPGRRPSADGEGSLSQVPIVPTAQPRVRPPASAAHPGATATGYEQVPERSAGPPATAALQSEDQLAWAVASSFSHPAMTAALARALAPFYSSRGSAATASGVPPLRGVEPGSSSLL